MNMAFRASRARGMAGTSVFAFFHLNLAFSSIPEERRDEVIARCYRPLFQLAARVGPIGIEISGYTLEEIAARDPGWIAEARRLLAAGRIELIGSGYSQMIGPLVPARVTRENLRLGLEAYRQHLGARPRLALVNEQAYAAGLVGLYRDAGFDGLIMDFDNPFAAHPEWDGAIAFAPQRAKGADGCEIGLVWSNTALFQQMQRLAHGDIELDAWRRFVAAKAAPGRALCLYASDAEIFDFRPGRFRTEERLSGESEWNRIAAALEAALSDGAALVVPSAILDMAGGGEVLRLESPAVPVPVKKQRKYNLARWAVTGRGSLAINAACERVYRGMLADEATADWKELCYLWASDFRTHLTAPRWQAYCERLKAAETRWAAALPPFPPAPATPPCETRFIDIAANGLTARLDRRRGLAIQRLHFARHAEPAVGGLPHGFFDGIALAADWYTGDCVFEAPGEHKLTDLEWCEARLARDGKAVIAHARIETPKGLIEKQMRFAAGRVDFDLLFHWDEWEKGVLRLGHFTLLPGAFDAARLTLVTCNGGGAETFALAGQTIDHGAPVSFLVSSSHGFGMTEGWAEIGDDRTRLRIENDRATAPLLGLLTHRESSGKLFCQLQLSAQELDDTSKPTPYAPGPRRFRFSIASA